LRQDKRHRHKLQLFFEILCAIEEDRINTGMVKPTHVQNFSRLSYDKLMNHLTELEVKELIYRDDNGLISITSRGQKYVKQYAELITFIDNVSL
jgi:predicted transcriptional regulator